MEASKPYPLLDPCRYSGYLFEKNAYPGCSGYLFEKRIVFVVLDTYSKTNIIVDLSIGVELVSRIFAAWDQDPPHAYVYKM